MNMILKKIQLSLVTRRSVSHYTRNKSTIHKMKIHQIFKNRNSSKQFLFFLTVKGVFFVGFLLLTMGYNNNSWILLLSRKKRDMLSCVAQGKARSHTAAQTQELNMSFGLEQMDHPP